MKIGQSAVDESREEAAPLLPGRSSEVEEWRGIEGYLNYEVSDQGRVRNQETGRLVVQSKISQGYMIVNLRKNGEGKSHLVHRLVLRAFKRPMRSDQRVTRHLNGVKTDNRLENLTWGDWVEIMADRVIHGTLTNGEKVGSAKLTAEQVRAIRERYARGGIPQSALAGEYGVRQSLINRIIHSKLWRHLK